MAPRQGSYRSLKFYKNYLKPWSAWKMGYLAYLANDTWKSLHLDKISTLENITVICIMIHLLFYDLQGFHLSQRGLSQQTQNICITFVQSRPNVFNIGPTSYKCHTNVLRLSGICHRALYEPTSDPPEFYIYFTCLNVFFPCLNWSLKNVLNPFCAGPSLYVIQRQSPHWKN